MFTIIPTAPSIGKLGGFGPKGVFYPEEVVLPLAALKLGRPVKWVEDRSEHFVSTAQQRDQQWTLEVAADDAGRLLGVRGRCLRVLEEFAPCVRAIPCKGVSLRICLHDAEPQRSTYPIRGPETRFGPESV